MKRTFFVSGIALTMLFFLATKAVADEEVFGNFENVLLAADEQKMDAEQPMPSDYWLGIHCLPVSPALQAQLHLPDNQGIVVADIVPDSPAAKAGLAQYDVILKAGDKNLADVSDLLQTVGAVKDKEMKLEILRNGQAKTIAITPAKRPEGANAASPEAPFAGNAEALQKWIEQLPPGVRFDTRGPMQFRFFKPGVILPPGAPFHAPLPGNMSITISKTGDKPADIVVKMGDEKWEVTEKDLDKLPKKVRPHVDRMLGLATGTGDGAKRWEVIVPPPAPQLPGMPPPPEVTNPPGLKNIKPLDGFEKRLEKRLEEMKQRLERIENELKDRHQGDKTPEQPQPTEKGEATPGKTTL